ncbi:MAG: hypothetical protein JWQ74_393 [Marmoricola sp.]|nr:hypothetical protein [Marmoricola sp.]
MNFPLRRKKAAALPGTTVTVRNHRDLMSLVPRINEGDLVVIDQRDLDAQTAKLLQARRPYAVLNAAELISGRFANLGPQVLADAGIVLLEGDRDRVLALQDGARLRLDGTTLYAGAVVVTDVRAMSPDQVAAKMEQARAGLTSQLDSFAHSASEFLRREEDLLLHGRGLPPLRAKLQGRAALVVGPGAEVTDLRRLKAFLREQKPVLIAVDTGAEVLIARGLRPDALVLSGAIPVTNKAISRSREVVLVGANETVRRRVEKRNLPTYDVTSSAGPVDIGLLLAYRGGARLVVPVGSPATLEDFIDRDRNDQASSVLTRLRLGTTLVEAAAVPLLYTGRVRRWQLALVLVAAVAVLALTVAATPVGNGWWHDLHAHLPFGLDR